MKELRDKITAFEVRRMLGSILGAFLYAVGINLFVTPAGLYTGGLMGICQVIRTLLINAVGHDFGNIDIAGVIFYLINIPIFIIGFRKVGKKFLLKTIVTVTAMSAFLAVIPTVPLLEEDLLTQSLVGALISGFGIGLTLQMGSTGGGMDIVGLLLSKNHHISVGKVNLVVNAVLYGWCLFLFDVRIVIYCLIYAAVYSITMDRVHLQNINLAVNIITKHNCPEMEQEIFSQLKRGITKWNSMGAYTQQDEEVLFITLSKYELNQLREIVHKYDPEAFIVYSENVRIDGNFIKKL